MQGNESVNNQVHQLCTSGEQIGYMRPFHSKTDFETPARIMEPKRGLINSLRHLGDKLLKVKLVLQGEIVELQPM
eukprot:1420308-Karenia_brevis.AAC.1